MNARVGEIAEQLRGVTYAKSDASLEPRPGFVPILRANNITDDGLVFSNLIYVPQSRIGEKQKLRRGDIVIAASSGSLDVVGKAAQLRSEFHGAFGAFCKVLRPKQDAVDTSYLSHFFKTRSYRQKISSLAAGANINNLRNEHLDDLEIPLPSLPAQRRIATILDKADNLRRKRKRALELLDGLTQSIFLEMFGDPALNPRAYPMRTLRDISIKISDGPFGSNLKSEHYVDEGVRVIRLQNIGVGKFIDEDRAFISVEHFRSLSKHECLPSDVLVGTLGDPNLRACLQPSWLKQALNKADCVQIRVDPAQASAEYIAALINQPSTERLAQSLILGQTRARISMGRLRELALPIAPLAEQARFADTMQRLSLVELEEEQRLQAMDGLFSSLQHRAFSGQL